MPQRQQQQFEIDRLAAAGAAGRADQERLRLVGDRLHQTCDLDPVAPSPQVEERLTPQFALEQGVGARPDDPQRKAGMAIEFENERVGKHAPDLAGSMSLRSGALRPLFRARQ